MKELTLRQALVTDSPALAALAVTFTKANPSASPTALTDLTRADQCIEAVLDAPNCEVIVAEQSGQVVAAMVLSRIPSLTHLGRMTLFIDLLVVKEECRRKGIGTSLAEYAIRLARDNNAYKILLVTRTDNIAARRLYNRCAFQTSGIGLAFYVTP